MPSMPNVLVTGLLKPYVEGFAAELARLGYAPGAAAHELRLLAHLSCWMSDHGRGPVLTDEDVRRSWRCIVRRAAGSSVRWAGWRC